MPLAAAVAIAAVAKGVSSYSASKQAAKGASNALAQSTATADKASQDARNLYQTGQDARHAAEQNAVNFYQQNAQAKINPLIQGNKAAQDIVGQGLTQANNAILGLPVDTSFANAAQQVTPDYSRITSAQMPVKQQMDGSTVPQAPTALPQQNQQPVMGMLGGHFMRAQ